MSKINFTTRTWFSVTNFIDFNYAVFRKTLITLKYAKIEQEIPWFSVYRANGRPRDKHNLIITSPLCANITRWESTARTETGQMSRDRRKKKKQNRHRAYNATRDKNISAAMIEIVKNQRPNIKESFHSTKSSILTKWLL